MPLKMLDLQTKSAINSDDIQVQHQASNLASSPSLLPIDISQNEKRKKSTLIILEFNLKVDKLT
jgi:hypothetical protein